MTMPLFPITRWMLAALLATTPVTASERAAADIAMPHFRYDTGWLKISDQLAIGEVTAVAVDRRDHLWVLHRPRSVKDRPPAKIAPPILEFDRNGRFVRGFGGDSPDYDWPTVEHSLALGADGHVWIGGSYLGAAERADDMLLEFDRRGHFVRQIGKRGASAGNRDVANVHGPADIYVDPRTDDVYVADGYGNQRVIVFGGHNGRYRRMWGAFGAAPPATPSAPPPPRPIAAAAARGPDGFSGVHGVEIARDGRIYVSDRMHQRIQVFDAAGNFLTQGQVNEGAPSPATASGLALSTDRAQKYLFVADWGNHMLLVLDRETLRTIGTIGRKGTAPGEFIGPHLLAIDSKGVLYVAEVQGRRLQRLVPTR